MRTRLLGSAAATFDRAVVAALQMRNRAVRSRAESLTHDERLERLAQIREAYGAPGLVESPDTYFVPPPAMRPQVRRVRALAWGGECLETSWPSAFEPFAPGVRDAYLAHAPNRTAHARLYVGTAPRPAVILVHGYMTGQWAIEERAWPIRWLNARGLDVALTVLPFHGVRGRAEGGAPPFPGADPRFTNEGFRQAVADVRVLMALLKERGARGVGIVGMSLGGYTAALMATLERDLAFAVPMIPLSSIADFARDQGRLGRGEQAAVQHAAIEAANHVVSPFARPPRLATERMLVVGAEADQVTPIAHAERLAAHLGAQLLRVQGGHLIQTWRREAFRAVRGMLQRGGVI
ncbi:MAG TPA: YqiA/YcfP family alpha/beta fold hydrolase [Polyangiaceae bacterium]